MEEKAIRGLPWTFLTFASQKVVSSLTTIALARLLLPDDFGLVALAVLASDVISLLRDLGIGGAMIVRQDLDRRSQGTMLTLMIGSSALTAGLVAGMAPLAAFVLGESRLTTLLLVMAATSFFGGLSLYYDTLLQRELEFKRRFVVRLGSTLVYAAVALACAVAGLEVWSLVIGLIAGMVSSTVIAMALAPYRVMPAFDRSRARDILKSGRGFLAQTILVFGQHNADFLVVGRVLGPTQLGLYTVAFRVAELPYVAVAEPVSRAIFPGFARMRHRGEQVVSSYLTTQRAVALVVTPVAIILSASAEPFTELVFGDRWVPMIGALAVLALWAWVRGIQVTQSWILNATANQDLTAKIWAALFFVLVPALVPAAVYGSIETVAWVVFGNGVLALLAQAVAVNRRLEITVREQWGAVRAAAYAAPVTWCATWVAEEMLDGVAPAAELAVCTAVGVVSYVAVVSVCAPGVLRETAGRIVQIMGVRAWRPVARGRQQ